MKPPYNHAILRERLLRRIGLWEDNQPKLEYEFLINEVRKTVWCQPFLEYMFNRLLMGYLRYGPKKPNAPKYNYIKAIKDKIKLYEEIGNDELLVDIGNYAMLEFRHGDHPLKHFSAYDDAGGHAELKK